MARKITFKDGPLKGKTYLIPEDMKRLTHTGGHYRITAKTNTWEPATTKRGDSPVVATVDETADADTGSEQ